MCGRHRWLAYILGTVAVIGTCSARADGGRITFSGAIVTPTCSVSANAAAQADGGHIAHRPYACGGQSQAMGHSDASTYQLSVVRLDEATVAGSQLLRYFVGYRASLSAADARMVTQTYE